MNIYALKGHKVKVTEDTKNNGHDHDKEKVRKYLKLNKEYTVKITNVGGWKTFVYLEEIGDVACFNSVNFVDCIEQDSEKDKKHKDYYVFNYRKTK
jgi:hypothetical protein